MGKNKLTYLVLSDIHLGHHINKTELIVENLRNFFIKNHKLLHSLDIIFLAGDVFDRLLPSSSHDFILANIWLTELTKYCVEHKIKLRILEGTPSHDWKQSKLITTVIEEFKLELDFMYIDTLYIEHMQDLDLTVLYVPDEYKHKAEDTWKEVKKLLKENKLVQVDIAIMHGQFHYQLPFMLESSHTEENYLSIVKHYISIGHIHSHSVRDRILAQGSFDRLVHSEEEDKGGMLITLDKEKGDSFQFLVNENSMKFLTFKYENKDIEYIIKDLEVKCKGLPPYSNIRIKTDIHTELNKNTKAFKDRFFNLKFKIEPLHKSITITDGFKLLNKKALEESFSITKDNIEELLDKEMSKHTLAVDEYKLYKQMLEEVK